jgi:hypothetical protein
MVERQVALRDPRHQAVLLELAGAVRPGEEAAVVAMLSSSTMNAPGWPSR